MSVRSAAEQLLQGAERGLYQGALDVMFVSLVQCPIETGTLRSSARIEEPVRTPDALTIEFGYGYGEQRNPLTGETASQYAIPVHERLDVHHAPPTKAKFLEDPMLAYITLFQRTLETSITRAEKTAEGLRTFNEPLQVSTEAAGLAPPNPGAARRAQLLAVASGIGAARAVGAFLGGLG